MKKSNWKLPRLDGPIDPERIARAQTSEALYFHWRKPCNRGCGFPKPKLTEFQKAMKEIERRS